MLKGKKVTVSVKKNANGTHRVIVSPMEIKIKSTGEQVIWKSVHADVMVLFDKGDDSPFKKSSFSSPANTQHGRSGEPKKPSKTIKVYRYSLEITPKPVIRIGRRDKVDPIVVDPIIVIDDGGRGKPTKHS